MNDTSTSQLGTSQTIAAAVAIVVFSALSLAAGLTSSGFLEADGCTHYLYARFALSDPHFLVNVWGRPLFTGLYAIPAAFGGLAGARTMSLLLAILCALVAMLIAWRQQLRWPALALIFTLAQPLVFLHSFSELTELLFATLIGFAFLAYQGRHFLVMAILLAVAPLSRPEGSAFILMGAVALVLHRKWWWLAVLPIPLVLWNHAGWTISGRNGPWWQWLPSNWPYSSTSLYERGHPLYFLGLLPAITSPLIFPATCIGIWMCLRRRVGESHRDRCDIILTLIPLMILAGHSLLYATGKLASSGEPRYLLIVAPFWGVLAARGWEWVFERFNWRHPISWAGAAAMSVLIANAAYPVVPLVPTDDHARSQRFVDWYRSSGAGERVPRICTAQMTVYYLLDISPLDKQRSVQFRREDLAVPRSDTLVLWDPIYSLYNADDRRSIRLEQLLDAGWMIDEAGTSAIGGEWRVLRAPG